MLGKKKKLLVVLAGPTASGKTEFSLKIAQHFGAEIISADSRQVYKEMKIGTAIPNTDELNTAKHHFIHNISIHDNYNVGIYEKQVIDFLNYYFVNHEIAILVGGTGLYIDAILNGIDVFPDIDEKIKSKVIEDFNNCGIELLQNELYEKDLKYYKSVDLNNPHRLIRAISVIRQSGIKYSDFVNKNNIIRKFEHINFCIDLPREVLYNRINIRVDTMIYKGLIQEAKDLYEYKNMKALQTVGYKELFEYFDGLCSLDEAIGKIKQNTRRYAKRQMTWFRNKGNWNFIFPDKIENILNLINKKIIEIQNGN